MVHLQLSAVNMTEQEDQEVAVDAGLSADYCHLVDLIPTCLEDAVGPKTIDRHD